MTSSSAAVVLLTPAEYASIREKSLCKRNLVTLPGLYFYLLETKKVKEWDPKCTFKAIVKHASIIWLDKKQ